MLKTETGEQQLLDYECEADIETTQGIFDHISEQFGAAPWWLISGSFHALMILLVTLIVTALVQVEEEEMVIVISCPQVQPPLFDPIKPRTVFQASATPVELPPIEDSVVVHEDMEVAEINETADDSNDQMAQGEEDNLSDLAMTGNGDVGAMGLGGGGASGPYGTRDGRGRKRAARIGGGGEDTESAVEAALRWLARNQEADGRWDCVKHGGKKADVSMAGFALLAFLGAGHTEKVGKFKKNVQQAVAWLKSIQRDNGSYYINGEKGGVGYSHAIAGLAMAEAAGMGRVKSTIKSAQQGINYSVDIHQFGKDSDKLGWRYVAQSAKQDLSVTGWYIMQLKSAKVAGLQVDQNSFFGAIAFLDKVEAKGAGGGDGSMGSGGHRYGYTNASGVTPRRTAIGCLARQFLGWNKDELQGGVDYFVEKGGVPEWGANGGKVDLYYWYYGTFCAFQQQGDVWSKWNKAMKKALVDNQRIGGAEDGSWDAVGAWAGNWGRVGQTALGCLCLEVYYRYLPMYQK